MSEIPMFYAVQILLPSPYSRTKVTKPNLRLAEVPVVGDILTFAELANEDGKHPAFVVVGRMFHCVDDAIRVVTLACDITKISPGEYSLSDPDVVWLSPR